MPFPAIGAETKCPSIQAKAHHSKNSTVAATEAASWCTIQVDGANADSQGIDRGIFWCVGESLSAISRNDQIAQAIGESMKLVLPLMVVPTLPDGSISSSDLEMLSFRAPFDVSAGSCLSWFENLSSSTSNFLPQLTSPFFQEISATLLSFGENDLWDCFLRGESTGSLTCSMDDGRVNMTFSTSLGAHLISLPAR